MGISYEKMYEIHYYECDKNLNCTLESIMNFLGDVGNKHAESLNVGMDYLTERNITWVFYKYNIKVNRYPEYEEKIRVKTVAEEFKKFYALRSYEIYDEKNIKICLLYTSVIGGGQIDGPSAGAAITICIISALLNRKIRQDVAITGEISLRGKVKPVGGIFEKIYGARRKGIKLVLVPKDNEKEIPLGLNDIEVRAVSNIEELMEIVFE